MPANMSLVHPGMRQNRLALAFQNQRWMEEVVKLEPYMVFCWCPAYYAWPYCMLCGKFCFPYIDSTSQPEHDTEDDGPATGGDDGPATGGDDFSGCPSDCESDTAGANSTSCGRANPIGTVPCACTSHGLPKSGVGTLCRSLSRWPDAPTVEGDLPQIRLPRDRQGHQRNVAEWRMRGNEYSIAQALGRDHLLPFYSMS